MIESDEKQLHIKNIMKHASYDELEMIFLESKRELDRRFLEQKTICGIIKAGDVQVWKH